MLSRRKPRSSFSHSHNICDRGSAPHQYSTRMCHVFTCEQNSPVLCDTKEPAFIAVNSTTQKKLIRETKMIAKKLNNVSPVYSSWLGKQVVLLVTIRQCHVPMPCSIIGESLADVRVRVHPGWEMDIRKELILAVEEDTVAVNTLVN